MILVTLLLRENTHSLLTAVHCHLSHSRELHRESRAFGHTAWEAPDTREGTLVWRALLSSSCSPLDENATQRMSLCWLSTAQQLPTQSRSEVQLSDTAAELPAMEAVRGAKPCHTTHEATSGTEPNTNPTHHIVAELGTAT